MNIEENLVSRQPKWKFRLSIKPNLSKKFCEMIEKFAIFMLLCFTVILGSSVLSENVKKKSLREEIVKVPQVSSLKAIRNSDGPTTLSPVTTAPIISAKFSRNDTISTTNSTESSSDSGDEEESSALENETTTKTPPANQTEFPLSKLSPSLLLTSNRATTKKVAATTSLVKETRSSGSYTDLHEFMGKPKSSL